MSNFIHSSIAIKSLDVPAIKVWYECRFADPNGNGWAYIEAHKSRTTMWRYLNDKRLFRSYKKEGNLYKVYYQSTYNVCINLNISNLGAISETDTTHDLAEQAALIQAIKLQQQSMWLCKQEYKVNLKPQNFFNKEGVPSDNGYGGKDFYGVNPKLIPFQKRRILFLEVESFYGASQDGIAKRLGICRQTAAKLLENSSKIQLALKSSWYHYYKAKFEASENFGVPPEKGFIFKSKSLVSGVVSKISTYVYYPLFSLCNQKHRRRQLDLTRAKFV